MGSKRRIAKEILPILLKDRKPGQWYVEPFMGGCNTLELVDGLRMGADINEYLVAYFEALTSGWLPPDQLSEQAYNQIKNNKDKYSKELVAFAGFPCSFGAKWFGGYARSMKADGYTPRSHSNEAFRSAKVQSKKLRECKFKHSDYWNLSIPVGSIIYCDPPYQGTTEYKDKFDHERFWEWCREMSTRGMTVFISEYSAPADFECVWESKPLSKSGSIRKKTERPSEKLFAKFPSST